MKRNDYEEPTMRVVSLQQRRHLLAACSSDDQTTEPAEQRVPVTLACSTIDATETRAAQNLNEGTFASGESVKVRISNTGAGEWTDYTFTTGSAGTMTAPDPAPYYPAGAQNIDIAAYYPATAGTTFSVATDQTADASYKASDLMFASVENQAKQAEAVNLAFQHKMAKLCVNITAGQGVGSITSVSLLNVKPTVSFNPSTGAVGSASGDATTIAVSNQGAALIPAQTIDGGLLSIVTDKGTATYSVASKAFAAGQLYTLNITVNLRAVGTTTAITGWTSEGTVTVNPVTNQKTPAGLVAVDMGNGLKWANMNVGAETETDYGTFFAWGETTGCTVIGSTTTLAEGNVKTKFTWATYALCNKTGTTLNKYNYTSSAGYVDNKDELERVHDAASVNWGGSWRMPTDAEWTWLRKNCTWTWTTQNGVNGYVVERNGNSIFLPAAGRLCDTEFVNTDKEGLYWSSSISRTYSSHGSDLIFWSTGVENNMCYRSYGLSVRAVTE